MPILTPYKVNSYRRICDVCGRPRQIEDIRFSDGVAICTLHKEFRTALQLNKINARTRPIRILPVPQPKPFAPIDTWGAEEAQILNFVLATAPYDTVNVTSNAGAITGNRSYQAYGWSIVYLTSLLAEDKRPAAWLAAARTKAIALGVEVMTFQNAVTVTSSISGGFGRRTLNASDANAYYSSDNALLCAALCRLYTATGDSRFLRGARSAAHFLANLHATAKWASGGKPYLGTFPMNRSGSTITADYYPTGLLGLWALTLLQALVGDETIGQRTTALGAFSTAPARPISEIITALRAFWDPVVTIAGEYYSSGAWANTSPPSDEWATALFALAEVDGVSTQVATLWDYLMTYTSDSAITGTYDPSLALSTTFDTTTLKNAAGFYDWGAAGLMAKVCSARNRAAVKRAKDALAEPRARYTTEIHSPRGSETLYLGPLGYSTLEFAPVTSGTTTRQQSVIRASKTGLIYRQLPQGWIGQGHE